MTRKSPKRTPKAEAVLPAETRVRTLLTFLQNDVATLRQGALLDVAEDLSRVLGEPGDETFPDFTDDLNASEDVPFEQLAEIPRASLLVFQNTLRDGMRRLYAGNAWSPLPLPVELRPTYQVVGGVLVRRYEGLYEHAVMAHAMDLLVQFWPQIRRCERRDCGKFFLPSHGRQRHHDPSCSNIERSRRYVKKRDYTKEKERRVLKTGPGRGKGKKR